MRGAALVSRSCYKKLLFMIWWLETTGVCSLIAGQNSEISITGLKSSFQQAFAPSGGNGRESMPCLFQLLVVASIPWLVVDERAAHCD